MAHSNFGKFQIMALCMLMIRGCVVFFFLILPFMEASYLSSCEVVRYVRLLKLCTDCEKGCVILTHMLKKSVETMMLFASVKYLGGILASEI